MLTYAGELLTIGSNEARWLYLSDIQSARTGATAVVASKAGAFVMLTKVHTSPMLTYADVC
jgi:hypothetical protein